MNKLVKMSLVAAVAVAGLNVSASAGSLEEAIKGVDISGSIAYRYDDRTTTATGVVDPVDGRKANRYKLVTKVKVPVNDTVTANLTFAAGTMGLPHGGTERADANIVTTNLIHANFTFKLGDATVTAGRQGIATPWTTAGNYIDGTQFGSGITASIPVGPVTLAGAYFLNNNIAGISDNDIAVIAALGSFGMVDAQLWYANIGDTSSAENDGADALTLVLGGTVGPVKAEFRHSELKGDEAGSKKQKLDSLQASAKFGAFGVSATYAKGGKDGEEVSLDAHANNANYIYSGWTTSLGGGDKYDADTYGIGVNMDIMSGLNISLNYSEMNWNTDPVATAANEVNRDETKIQLSYKMSSNFGGYVRLAQSNTDYSVASGEADTEQTLGRLQIKYSF